MKQLVREDAADGRVGLIIGQCNGSCEQAPQIWVDEIDLLKW